MLASAAAFAKAGAQQGPSAYSIELNALRPQPGDILLAKIAGQDVNESADVVAVINDTQRDGELPDQSAIELLEYPEQVRYLLLGLQQHTPLIELIRAKAQPSAEASQDTILAALLLYPIESYQLLHMLEKDEHFSSSLVMAVAERAGLDQGWRFLASIRSADAIKIQPLFHSSSITLFNQQLDHHADIRFRELGSTTWQVGLPLQWDPVRSALSGSIVHLQPDTRYEVEITRFKGQQLLDQQVEQFTTRANSPPVDPQKVYRLSDIYTGGRLDLEALKIQGTEQGWAKIVGDKDTPIIAGEGDNSAIKIGNNSYILFENITVVGGRKNAINSYKAHHLWFNGCDISGWGRAPNVEKNGKFYESEQDKSPINYDSAFALMRTGVVVVENCTVHSPRAKANNWGNGHPMGPNAYLAWANHPDPEFKGQVVIRHNRFFGSRDHRFNDVIEGDSNPRMWGGFVRDSAIYDNYLAYANDDVVELDGGQSNVLFYNNEVEQGYCGVSAIPNQLGPSYIFNNHIHNLGDERGSAWAGIKMGGVYAAPAGRTLIFENLIVNKSANAIAGARFEGDYSYWAMVRNNIMLNKSSWDNKGYGVIDKSAFAVFSNNLIYNLELNEAKIKAVIAVPYQYARQLEQDYAQKILASDAHSYPLPVETERIANFSQLSAEGVSQVGIISQGENQP
ncbi:right-handed parallel beta-helix repeat-containing protein [Neptunicella sp. SCSIO 80796]|uniref:right-handed parallel beta-helix repeat-containing protein n=1 Tax=Neptunicella plasticusilytica TaxID=3117012 RepID=UPI003A4D43DF